MSSTAALESLEKLARDLIRADLDLDLAANARHAAESKLAEALEKATGSNELVIAVGIDDRVMRSSTIDERDDFFVRKRYIIGPLRSFADLA